MAHWSLALAQNISTAPDTVYVLQSQSQTQIGGLSIQEISALSTILLALLTAGYVVVVYFQLKEMRKRREPDVYAELKVGRFGRISIILSNRGELPATDISVDVIADEIEWEDGRLSDSEVVTDGRSYLKPDGKILYPAGRAETGEDAEHGDVSIEVTYYDEGGARNTRTVEYNLKGFDDAHLESLKDPSDKVADAIGNAATKISRKVGTRRSKERLKEALKGAKSTCSYCKEEIYSDAKKCPHCHEWLPESEDGEEEG